MSRTFRQIVLEAFLKLKKDIKSAKWVIIAIIAYFAFLRKFLYSMCPVVVATGFPCPSCGLTRAGFLLLHLDFAGAFHMHPFIYVAAALIIIAGWNRYILLRKQPEWMKWCVIVAMLMLIVFYVWRMWKYFPGEPPMSYYSHHLGWRITNFLSEYI